MKTILSPESVIVVNGWACVETGHHNCAGGTAESGYHHEKFCGLEPLCEIDKARIHRVFLWSIFEHRWQVEHKGNPISFVRFENALKFANDTVRRSVLNG